MLNLKNNMKIHFIGIGGAGMLPLSIHSKVLGHIVSGSDLSDENFHILYEEGIYPVKGHKNVNSDIDLVVYSVAVSEDNSEMVSARNQNIPIVKRAEYLGMITKSSHAILVSGSHGKSTTSAMTADMLNNDDNFKATALIGAETISRNSNYYKGCGDYIILEADEYDRSFLKLYPTDLIIMNIDDDHLDIYGDIEGLKHGFKELISKLNENSILIYNGDDKMTVETVQSSKSKKISFGIKNPCVYNAENIEYKNFYTKFDLYNEGKFITQLEYFYSGDHNVYNMLAAVSLLCEYNVKGKRISELVKYFKGVKRRQEIIYQDSDYILMDDYGHHPSE
ncbi:MAG: hypothetical protein KKD38_00735, partial [Candidatus Delongbacteria bacterium]|nr:hypothetical protein [Candidatus Delongbacteria bacterium]MCG2760626.1 Mur ligase domain-containing protein [Candidatus Delongbacteria bacterium]